MTKRKKSGRPPQQPAVTYVQVSPEKLRAHLATQRGFLRRSCEAYDAGDTDEFVRMALAVRVLCHDTAVSHSLLGQLGMKLLQFTSTSSPFDSRNLIATTGLLLIHLTEGTAKYEPKLGSAANEPRQLAFIDWWDEVVICDARRRKLRRRDLVLTIANQDGGAHVAPELDEVYHDLAANNSIGLQFHYNGKNFPLDDAEKASMRQIAYEMLLFLDGTGTQRPLPAT